MTITEPPPSNLEPLGQLALPGVEITATSATFVGVVDRTELALRLIGLARSVSTARWVVGDLFWAMVAEDGGDDLEAVRVFARLGFDQAWLSTAWDVAEAVPPERRRSDLSWGHHEAVSHLSGDDQVAWLDRAAVEPLTVVGLRHALKAHAARHQGRLGEDDGEGDDPPTPLPKIPRPALARMAAAWDLAPDGWILVHRGDFDVRVPGR